jgi:hypothetical protein
MDDVRSVALPFLSFNEYMLTLQMSSQVVGL